MQPFASFSFNDSETEDVAPSGTLAAFFAPESPSGEVEALPLILVCLMEQFPSLSVMQLPSHLHPLRSGSTDTACVSKTPFTILASWLSPFFLFTALSPHVSVLLAALFGDEAP